MKKNCKSNIYRCLLFPIQKIMPRSNNAMNPEFMGTGIGHDQPSRPPTKRAKLLSMIEAYFISLQETPVGQVFFNEIESDNWEIFYNIPFSQ